MGQRFLRTFGMGGAGGLMTMARPSDGGGTVVGRNNRISNAEIDRSCPICLCKLPLNPLQRKTLDCCGHSFCRKCLNGGGGGGSGGGDVASSSSATNITRNASRNIIDTCPMCRSPIIKKSLQGRLKQAGRLVDNARIGSGSGDVTSSSLDRGIAILEQIVRESCITGGGGAAAGQQHRLSSSSSEEFVGTTAAAAADTTTTDTIAAASSSSSSPFSSVFPHHRHPQKGRSRREASRVMPEVYHTLARALCKKDTPESLERALQVLQTVLVTTTVTTTITSTADEYLQQQQQQPPTSSHATTATTSDNRHVANMRVGGTTVGIVKPHYATVSYSKPTTAGSVGLMKLLGPNVTISPQSKFRAQAYFLQAEVFRKQELLLLIQTSSPRTAGGSRRSVAVATGGSSTDATTTTEHTQQQQQQQQQQRRCHLQRRRQEAYQLAAQSDPHNAALLLACARRMSMSSSHDETHGEKEQQQQQQLALYRQIVTVNKYHVEANLWLAHHYRQHAVQLAFPEKRAVAAAAATTTATSPSSVSSPPPHDNGGGDVDGRHNTNAGAVPVPSYASHQSTSTSSQQQQQQQSQAQLQQQLQAVLTSYLACILRAEFRAVTEADKQACSGHREELKVAFPAFYSKARQMDRVSAAYVPF